MFRKLTRYLNEFIIAILYAPNIWTADLSGLNEQVKAVPVVELVQTKEPLIFINESKKFEPPPLDFFCPFQSKTLHDLDDRMRSQRKTFKDRVKRVRSLSTRTQTWANFLKESGSSDAQYYPVNKEFQ